MRRCAGPCGRPMAAEGVDHGAGEVEHAGRGLCGACYRKAYRSGEHIDHPRRLRPADELLDEWDLMRRAGMTRVEAAERLGMTEGALHRMLQRHRSDPRAQLGVRARAHVPVRDGLGRWAG